MKAVLPRPRIAMLGIAALCGGLALAWPAPAAGASLSAKDVQIVAKALGFLDPAPSGGVIAVLYSDGASKADADAIVGLFGAGVASHGGSVTAKAVSAAALGSGAGFIAVILASGAPANVAMTAAKAQHIPCIASIAQVQGGQCVMAVATDPKVLILLNRAEADGAGIRFASAFRMLIQEI